MMTVIKKLKENYKIFALSNTNALHKEVNKKRGFFDAFNKLFLSFEMGMKKPDKRIFIRILEET